MAAIKSHQNTMKSSKDKQLRARQRSDEMTHDALKLVELLTNELEPCANDLTLLTLKGHLIAEHLLETILIRLLAIPEIPKPKKNSRKIDLSFYQKLKLIEAVLTERTPGPNADLLMVVEELNNLRNRLAHNLKSHAEIEKDVHELICCYGSVTRRKQDPSKQLPEQLRDCLRHLCGFLLEVRGHFYCLEV